MPGTDIPPKRALWRRRFCNGISGRDAPRLKLARRRWTPASAEGVNCSGAPLRPQQRRGFSARVTPRERRASAATTVSALRLHRCFLASAPPSCGSTLRAMQRALLLGLLMPAMIHAAEKPLETWSAYGRLIVTQFVSAPFPHPARAQGHTWNGQFFPADKHYNDRTVALFIPEGFRPGKTVDAVVHFHGWGNHVSRVLDEHRLIEQFAASRRNAVLLVPQGPRDASDSFGGKLEEPDGFKRFMDEALATLRAGPEGRVFRKAQWGRIILSGHSGGYRVIAFILHHGGLTERVREVWLFDGLYAQTDKFARWFRNPATRFVNLYTENGGTKDDTDQLMAALRREGVPFFAGNESDVTAAQLRENRLLFLFTTVNHHDVVHAQSAFRRFLETSCLEEIRSRTSRRAQGDGPGGASSGPTDPGGPSRRSPNASVPR
jgi:hypothetical protein